MAVAVGQSTARNADFNIKDALAGREVLEKAYGRNADNVVSVLSGRVANYDLPKGVGRTDDMSKLVRQGQHLADNINTEAYRNRGLVQATGPNGNYLELAGRDSGDKEKLVQHMLNIKAAVEAQVEHKQLERDAGDSAYQRIQKEIFASETPKASRDFSAFEKTSSARLAREVLAEVELRYEAQRKTIDRVSEKEAEARRKEANATKANDFRTLKAEDAVKKHPDLVNAYAVVKAAELVAKQKFAAEPDQAKFTSMMKETVAQRIEQNKPLPEVKVKEPEQAQRRESPALER